MDDPKTVELLRDLLLRLRPSSSSSGADEELRYARKLLSSRLLPPPPSSDEVSAAESIKRSLAAAGRSSAALSFSDLHSKLLHLRFPSNRAALLHLLFNLSPLRRHNSAHTFTPFRPTPNHSSYSSQVKKSPTNSPLILSKDSDNIREIALREFSDLTSEDSEIPEETLVRDVLYASQGIDGRFIRFDCSSDSYIIHNSITIPRGTRILACRLCELGWLFRRVRGFITDSASQIAVAGAAGGTVAQAFAAALQDELTDYYRLLAVLESHSNHSIPSPASRSIKISENYLTLRRLSVWLAEPTVRMRLMAVLVDSCRELTGGAMAGEIHLHAQHGDPMVKEFMGRLLRRVCSPLFEMVRKWVLEGELEDVFGEFFIVSQPVKAESLWKEGYRIEKSMLPSFISHTLAQRILRTGKSINFLRVCCEDSGWADAAAEAAAHVGATTDRGSIKYGETDALEALVVEAAKRIDKHLMDVIFKRYRFKDHCLAIKRYLLLGQGDFVQYLMEKVGPELLEPANAISSFHLSGHLETAIRASNAQYDDRDILDRLKVKMMEHGDGDRGWDVFSLEYEARVPLDAVFSASVMKKYLKIFNFLWKLKRVEHALSGFWKLTKPNNLSSCDLTKESMGVKVQFLSLMRRCQVLWHEMNQFVMNFQHYIMFEVLEVSWARFSEGMDSAKDLDNLLAAHDKYLDSITEKFLLGENSRKIFELLIQLFSIILRFRSHADRWFERISDFQLPDRSKSKLKSKDQRTNQWLDGGRKAMMQHAKKFLGSMNVDLDKIAREYAAPFEYFVSQLPMQEHVDLKFLLFRLDFTEYYSRHSGRT